MKLAVLLLIFNRPDTTKQVFEAIRAYRPTRLYVAADGARADRPQEDSRCAEVRRIATAVDWPCEVHTLFRDRNLGCRRAVSEAIDWFFAAEDRGTILEDDCVPDPSWFRFASEMLDRYADDTRIMCVSANHFHGSAHSPAHSYFFSRYNHCWGWATWRRAWLHYDRDMQAWPALRKSDWLLATGDGSNRFRRYWTRTFEQASRHIGPDSWAFRWTLSCWAQSGLTILPAKNLVGNVGFGATATNTTAAGGVESMPREALEFPLSHPTTVVRDVAADRWTDVNIFRITPINDLRQAIRATPVVGPYLARIKAFVWRCARGLSFEKNK